MITSFAYGVQIQRLATPQWLVKTTSRDGDTVVAGDTVSRMSRRNESGMPVLSLAHNAYWILTKARFTINIILTPTTR